VMSPCSGLQAGSFLWVLLGCGPLQDVISKARSFKPVCSKAEHEEGYGLCYGPTCRELQEEYEETNFYAEGMEGRCCDYNLTSYNTRDCKAWTSCIQSQWGEPVNCNSTR
jgi:hypothetical protein